MFLIYVRMYPWMFKMTLESYSVQQFVFVLHWSHVQLLVHWSMYWFARYHQPVPVLHYCSFLVYFLLILCYSDPYIAIDVTLEVNIVPDFISQWCLAWDIISSVIDSALFVNFSIDDEDYIATGEFNPHRPILLKTTDALLSYTTGKPSFACVIISIASPIQLIFWTKECIFTDIAVQ